MNITPCLNQLLSLNNLSETEMRDTMQAIMSGQVSDAQMAAFLIALRFKGETVAEIAAAASVLRDLATKINLSGAHIVDTCGTGGDGANTFNISTTCAFVVAAAGGKVAKHGNRSVSSTCGSADLLEAAGVNLQLTPTQVAQCVNTLGLGFLFAPNYHSAMQHTRQVRKDLGVRTIFNLLGPLVNPANAPNQLIGVFAKHWVEPLAQVLKQLGSDHVLVVNALDGLDEISIAAPTSIAELKAGEISTYTISPEQYGFKRASLTELAIANSEESLLMVKSVLDNQPSPATDIVLLNAGAAIYAANISTTLAKGIETAQHVIASGAARAKLDALVSYSNSF